MRAGFGGEQLDSIVAFGQTMRVLLAPLGEPGGIEQFAGHRLVFVTEVPDFEDDRVDLLFGVERREAAIVHHAFSVAADFDTAGPDPLQQVLLVHAADAERAPRSEARQGDGYRSGAVGHSHDRETGAVLQECGETSGSLLGRQVDDGLNAFGRKRVPVDVAAELAGEFQSLTACYGFTHD